MLLCAQLGYRSAAVARPQSPTSVLQGGKLHSSPDSAGSNGSDVPLALSEPVVKEGAAK